MFRTNLQLLNMCQQYLQRLGSRGTDIRVQQMNAANVGLTVFKKNSRPTIIINSVLCSESDEVIKTILAHEYAHVIAGDTARHKPQWFAIANKFSRQLGGLTVTENPVKTINFSLDYWIKNFKYVYRCRTCGKLIGFNDSQFKYLGSEVNHIGCGGSWKKIK